MTRLISRLSRLPGIGKRSAERMAFYLLKQPAEEAIELAEAIRELKQRTRSCSICFNVTESDPCPICADPQRDGGLVLVVEQPGDVVSIETTGLYKGVYHVLMGRIAPLDGVGAGDLSIDALLQRVRQGQQQNPQQTSPPDAKLETRNLKLETFSPIHEIILGLSPSLEGDGTALHLTDELAKLGVKVTRLARGLPYGSHMELLSKAVLADAIQGRG